MGRKNLFTLSSLMLVCILLAFVTGYLARDVIETATAELPILTQAYGILKDHGYDEIPADPALEYGMIRGMVAAYGDPYTSFVEPVQHELDSQNLQGSFGGIGVRLVREETGEVLLFPFPQGPAATAGIIDADRLVAVETLDIDSSTPIEAVTAEIRGPVGDPVVIKILREESGEILEFKIRRESVPLPSVTWHLAPEDQSVGVIEINLLAASTAAEVKDAIKNLEGQGATAFILDVRDNGGGLLDASVETARLFLERGPLLQQQYRGQKIETFNVETTGEFVELPLLVLINQNTASAAEILAGALQNKGRAQLIGNPSFGKDSIQLVFDLRDGSSLHVTAARWWLPSEEGELGENGLQPDIVLEESDTLGDPAVLKAIELFEDR